MNADQRRRLRIYLLLAALWFTAVLVMWTRVNHCSTASPC